MADYYPLQQGDTWTYSWVEDSYYSGTEIVIIDGTEIIDGVETVKMYYYNGYYEYDALAMTQEGLKEYKFVGDGGIYYVEYSPPLLRAPPQMSMGDKHTSSTGYTAYENGGEWAGTITFNLTLLSEETVTVPAGTFQALKFSYSDYWEEDNGCNGTEEGTIWLAYEIGVIKETGSETEYCLDYAYSGDYSMELMNATVGGVSYPDITDTDGDGIPDNEDNCPLDYNPQQGNIIYAYDDFNDNSISFNWSMWKDDPNIAIRETNQEIKIDGTTSQGGWNTLEYLTKFNQDVEASIRVRTPIIDWESAFSFVIWRDDPWGYYRILRDHWGYGVGGYLEGQDYWDSDSWSGTFGDEETNFHTYKIIYENQDMSFFVDNMYLYTIENVNFNNFNFGFAGEGWESNQDMDFRIDNFTIKEIGDFDNDNIGDVCDNCPYRYNAGQENICEPVTVSGYVFDIDYNPLEVTVELENPSKTIDLVTMADTNGYFEFVDVPNGYYEIEFNDDWPVLWEYTGGAIGDETPVLDATSNIQVNLTLLKIELTMDIDASEYHNGDIIKINITVTNNEDEDIEDWELGAELYFENETHEDWIDEEFFLVNLSSGETKSFLVYLQIPYDNEYDSLYVEGFMWKDEFYFESSKGLLEGELWQWQEKEINVTKPKFNIHLSKGWNLVSSPLNFTNLTETFLPIQPYFESMFVYDAEYQHFIEIDPFSPEHDEPDLSYGVWLKVSQDTILPITGKEFASPVDIVLYPGWNLMAWPSLEEQSILDGFENDIIYSYNGTWSSYIPNRPSNSLTTFKPGYGYWVKSQ